jgi:hypothetical protein
MAEPDWAAAEDFLFEQSACAIRKFAAEHPDEVFATFAFTVDSDYAGVALNFDTLENSLTEAKRAEQYQVKRRNRLFTTDRSWEDARYYVAHHTNRVDDCNLRGPFRYELVTFIELPTWEDYFNSSEECPELEGRIIVTVWRVVDRLVLSEAFAGLRQSPFFRVAFTFHDDEMIVLRVLNWPGSTWQAEPDAAATGETN